MDGHGLKSCKTLAHFSSYYLQKPCQLYIEIENSKCLKNIRHIAESHENQKEKMCKKMPLSAWKNFLFVGKKLYSSAEPEKKRRPGRSTRVNERSSAKEIEARALISATHGGI